MTGILLWPATGEDDVEGGLLLLGPGAVAASGGPGSGHHDRRGGGGGDAPPLLERLLELDELEDRHLLQLLWCDWHLLLLSLGRFRGLALCDVLVEDDEELPKRRGQDVVGALNRRRRPRRPPARGARPWRGARRAGAPRRRRASLPSITAPRTVRIRVWRAISDSFLAAAAGSSATNAIAVGPWSMSTRSGCSASSAARPCERVLGDVERGADLAERAADVCDLGDREAAIVGDDHRVGGADALGQLLDHPALLVNVHLSPPGLPLRRPPWRRTQGRPWRRALVPASVGFAV